MVECGGLENRYPRKGIVGSNPTPSAMISLKLKSDHDDVAVEVRRKPRTADAASFEVGFEGSAVRKYDMRHIYDVGGGDPKRSEKR